jgi:hypothetical protein
MHELKYVYYSPIYFKIHDDMIKYLQYRYIGSQISEIDV